LIAAMLDPNDNYRRCNHRGGDGGRSAGRSGGQLPGRLAEAERFFRPIVALGAGGISL
jgi:hypothetical protein